MLHQSNLSYNSLLSHQTILILRVTMSYSTSATKTISQQHLCKLYLPKSICSVLYSNRILLEFNFPASLTVRWRYISKVFIRQRAGWRRLENGWEGKLAQTHSECIKTYLRISVRVFISLSAYSLPLLSLPAGSTVILPSIVIHHSSIYGLKWRVTNAL